MKLQLPQMQQAAAGDAYSRQHDCRRRCRDHEGVARSRTECISAGELRAIVQKADETFNPGERVRLLSSGGMTRVTR